MVAARIIMLEAVSTETVPFLFGSPATARPPPWDMAADESVGGVRPLMRDGHQWLQSKLDAESKAKRQKYNNVWGNRPETAPPPPPPPRSSPVPTRPQSAASAGSDGSLPHNLSPADQRRALAVQAGVGKPLAVANRQK